VLLSVQINLYVVLARAVANAMNENPAPTTRENDEADAVVHDDIHQTLSQKRSWLSISHQPLLSPETRSDVLNNRTVNILNGTNLPLVPSFMESGLMDRTDNAGNDHETVWRQITVNEVPHVNNNSGISANELYRRTYNALLDADILSLNVSRRGDAGGVDVELHAHDCLIVLLDRRTTVMEFLHAGNQEYYVLIVSQLEGFRHQIQRAPHVVRHEWFHANNQDTRTRIAQNIINTWIHMRGGHFATITTGTQNVIENDDPRVLSATLHMLNYWICFGNL
jgi:hypothetical protein